MFFFLRGGGVWGCLLVCFVVVLFWGFLFDFCKKNPNQIFNTNVFLKEKINI